MPRATATGPVAYSTDADYRAIVTEALSLLTTAGFQQAADTGQINLSTATKPAINTYTDFIIVRPNDSFQATSPIFIKIEFGTGASSTHFRCRYTIGTSTNGAGTITGSIYLSAQTVGNSNGFSGGNYPSYCAHKNGYYMLAFKPGSLASDCMPLGFLIQRTVDNTGAFTADGLTIIISGNTFTTVAAVVRVRFTPILDISSVISGRLLSFIPGGLADSRVGLAPQHFQHWMMMPRQRPMVGSCSTVRGEVALYQQFSALLVGAVSRNYLHLGGCFGDVITGASAGNPYGSISVLWED